MEYLIDKTHVGQDGFLKGHPGHRVYVLEAYLRRFDNDPKRRKDGTYHAFQINERVPQIGDIIIQDRKDKLEIGDVVEFSRIPKTLDNGRRLHGDVVVEVGANFVVAIGGNLGNSVRKRRYSLDNNHHLVVDQEQLYTQEDDSGNLPDLPLEDRSGNSSLHEHSTGRIFALLSPVEICAVILGQQVNGSQVLV